MDLHIDLPAKENCKRLDLSYGLICVGCGTCGRFNEKKPSRSSTLPSKLVSYLENIKFKIFSLFGCFSCKHFKLFSLSCKIGWIQGWFFFPDPDLYTKDKEYPFTDKLLYRGWKETRNGQCDYIKKGK